MKRSNMRADIIKSILDLVVLHLLTKEELCGNEIISKLKSKFNIYISPSMLYGTLNRLKEMNLVRLKENGETIKKKFSITDEGMNYKREKLRHYFTFGEILEGWFRT